MEYKKILNGLIKKLDKWEIEIRKEKEKIENVNEDWMYLNGKEHLIGEIYHEIYLLKEQYR